MGHCYSAVCYISDSLSTAVCYTNDPLSTTVCYTSDPLSIAVCYTSDPLSIPVIPMTPVTVVISMTPCPQLLCVCMVRGVGQCCLFTSDLLSTAAVWVYGERSAAAPHQPGFTGSGSRSGDAAHAGGADATSPSGHPGHGQRATWRCTSPEGRGHWALLRTAEYTR